LTFELRGKKLKGRWALVRMHASERYKGDRNWLLFKKEDSIAVPAAARARFAARATPRAAAKSGPRKPARKRPAFIKPQLAVLADEAPTGDGWVHEVKLDGYRIELIIDAEDARLYTRSGADWTDRFQSIARAAEELPGKSLILDGEVVVPDASGVSSFSALQAALKGERAAGFQYHVFDLLHFDGRDLRSYALTVRRQALER